MPYEFDFANVVSKDHLVRRMNGVVTGILAGVRQHLRPFYSDIARPSVDPQPISLFGYCFGVRHERRLGD